METNSWVCGRFVLTLPSAKATGSTIPAGVCNYVDAAVAHRSRTSRRHGGATMPPPPQETHLMSNYSKLRSPLKSGPGSCDAHDSNSGTTLAGYRWQSKLLATPLFKRFLDSTKKQCPKSGHPRRIEVAVRIDGQVVQYLGV